jgi:hypothetical protein
MHAALSEYFDMSDEYLYIFGTNIEKFGTFLSHLKTEFPLNVYLYKNQDLENMAYLSKT